MGERTNEDGLNDCVVFAGSKLLICELELVYSTLLIDGKQTIVPKQWEIVLPKYMHSNSPMTSTGSFTRETGLGDELILVFLMLMG